MLKKAHPKQKLKISKQNLKLKVLRLTLNNYLPIIYRRFASRNAIGIPAFFYRAGGLQTMMKRNTAAIFGIIIAAQLCLTPYAGTKVQAAELEEGQMFEDSSEDTETFEDASIPDYAVGRET